MRAWAVVPSVGARSNRGDVVLRKLGRERRHPQAGVVYRRKGVVYHPRRSWAGERMMPTGWKPPEVHPLPFPDRGVAIPPPQQPEL